MKINKLFLILICNGYNVNICDAVLLEEIYLNAEMSAMIDTYASEHFFNDFKIAQYKQCMANISKIEENILAFNARLQAFHNAVQNPNVLHHENLRKEGAVLLKQIIETKHSYAHLKKMIPIFKLPTNHTKLGEAMVPIAESKIFTKEESQIFWDYNIHVVEIGKDYFEQKINSTFNLPHKSE